MLVKDFQIELVWPPVPVRDMNSARERTIPCGFSVHIPLRLSERFPNSTPVVVLMHLINDGSISPASPNQILRRNANAARTDRRE